MRCVRSGAPVKHRLEPQSELPQKTAVTWRELGNCPGLIPSPGSVLTHCCAYIIRLINFYCSSYVKCPLLCKMHSNKPFLTTDLSQSLSRRSTIRALHISATMCSNVWLFVKSLGAFILPHARILAECSDALLAGS